MADDDRLYATATVRNREPIADVLQTCLPDNGMVLEIASGTGEHACYFGGRFPHLIWQPSEPDAHLRRSISAWAGRLGLKNVLPPLEIDAAAPTWPVVRAEAVVCINMVHIAPFAACEGLMRNAAKVLPRGGVLYMYGPFWVEGVTAAPSNEAFDASLKAQNAAWGVRDLNEVAKVGNRSGMVMRAPVAMPANNFSVIFDRL